MGSLDFLFQGTPPTQVTNTGQTSTNVPTWLQEYAQGILSQGAQLASQPYPTYGGPTVAGQTPYSQQAAGEVAGLQGGYLPTLNAAMNLGTSGFAGGLGMMPGAAAAIQSSMNVTPQMMNPYVGNVIQKAEDTATQYWQNQLMPSITNQFTAAGQPQSSADVNALGQAAKQITQNIQDTSQAALSGAFTNAQQAALAGGSALGSLGQTLGGLGYESMGALGTLAGQGQNLGLQGASALDAAGQELQQNQQANLNAAYNQFLQQQQYPYQQIGWLSNLMQGTIPGTTPGGTTSAQQQTVPAYYSSGQSPISAVGGLAGLFSNYGGGGARGGSFRHGRFQPRSLDSIDRRSGALQLVA